MFVSTVLLVLLLVASTFMGGNLNAVGGWRLESFDTRVPWYQIQINQEIPFQVKPQGWEGGPLVFWALVFWALFFPFVPSGGVRMMRCGRG